MSKKSLGNEKSLPAKMWSKKKRRWHRPCLESGTDKAHTGATKAARDRGGREEQLCFPRRQRSPGAGPQPQAGTGDPATGGAGRPGGARDRRPLAAVNGKRPLLYRACDVSRNIVWEGGRAVRKGKGGMSLLYIRKSLAHEMQSYFIIFSSYSRFNLNRSFEQHI